MGRHMIAVAHRIAIAQTRSIERVGNVTFLAPERDTTELGTFLIDEWLPAVRSEVEPSTFRGLAQHCSAYIVPKLGDIRICDLERETIRIFYRDLLETPKQRKAGFLSKAMVIAIATTLGWALQTLVECRRLPVNPAWGLRPRMTKAERYEPQVWTPAELLDFLDRARSDRLYPLWNLMALTGIRRGEALGLRWGDLSGDFKEIAIRRAMVVAGTTPYTTRPKGGSGRRIELLPETTAVLRRFKKAEKQRVAKRAAQRRPVPPLRADSYVFCQTSGANYAPSTITRNFIDLAQSLGLRRIRLHDLRHTHATHLFAAGANLKAVQERLGHMDPTYTINTYIHMMPTIQGAAVRSLTAMYRHTERDA